MLRRATQGVRLRLVQGGGPRSPGGSGGGRRVDTPDKVIYGIMGASVAGYGAANGMLGLTGSDFVSRHGVVTPYNCIDSGHLEALLISNFVIPTTGELIMTGLCLWFFARPIALIKGGRYLLGLYTGGGVTCNAACLLWSKSSLSRNIDAAVSKAKGTFGPRGATSTVYGYSILFNPTGTVHLWELLIRMSLVPLLFWGLDVYGAMQRGYFLPREVTDLAGAIAGASATRLDLLRPLVQRFFRRWR